MPGPIDVTGLTDDAIAEIEAHVRGKLPSAALTYTAPPHGWTCFHCGETFRTPGAARLHFGELPGAASHVVPDVTADADHLRRNLRARVTYLEEYAGGLDEDPNNQGAFWARTIARREAAWLRALLAQPVTP